MREVPGVTGVLPAGGVGCTQPKPCAFTCCSVACHGGGWPVPTPWPCTSRLALLALALTRLEPPALPPWRRLGAALLTHHTPVHGFAQQHRWFARAMPPLPAWQHAVLEGSFLSFHQVPLRLTVTLLSRCCVCPDCPMSPFPGLARCPQVLRLPRPAEADAGEARGHTCAWGIGAGRVPAMLCFVVVRIQLQCPPPLSSHCM